MIASRQAGLRPELRPAPGERVAGPAQREQSQRREGVRRRDADALLGKADGTIDHTMEVTGVTASGEPRVSEDEQPQQHHPQPVDQLGYEPSHGLTGSVRSPLTGVARRGSPFTRADRIPDRIPLGGIGRCGWSRLLVDEGQKTVVRLGDWPVSILDLGGNGGLPSVIDVEHRLGPVSGGRSEQGRSRRGAGTRAG